MTRNNKVVLGEITGFGARQYEGDNVFLHGAHQLDGQPFLDQYAGQYNMDERGVRARRPMLYGEEFTVPREAMQKLQAIQEREGAHFKLDDMGGVLDCEPFSITSISGAPGAFTLSANTAGTRTNIGSYTVPVGYKVIFDPTDVYQEVMFTPFTSVGTNDTNFIVGNFEVMIESATLGKAWRCYHSSTIWMRPGSSVASVGHLRKWQHKYIAVPADIIKFYFTAGTALSTANSVLEARVKMGRVVG